MNPSRIFIRRPIATSLIMIAILLMGIVAYKLLSVSSLPEVDYPTIQVSTFYPGASPDVMASAVTAPLERQFGQIPGLGQMTSTSSNGSAIITLQFNLDVNLDVAEQEVQEAINAASSYLPKDLPTPPVYSKVNPADAPIITLALTSTILPLPMVEDFADTRLAQRIAQLTGVGLVSISGGQRPAVRIRLNPNAVAAYGLTLEMVRAAISTANVNAAKGSFDGPRLAYTINANDQLLSSRDYKPLVMSYKNNAPVRLVDIAEVVDDAENVKLAAWMNQVPAVIMNIQRQSGANVIAVVDRIKQLIPQLSATLPAAIQITILNDRTTTIRESIRGVQFDLILSVMLVVLVIYLFLFNWRATIIPSVSVPLSLIGTFAAMYFLGFSINNLTLMALTIAAGFVVDDAIVMIENISRYLESGESPLQAALKGSGQIGFTIMSLTISLIAVLIPLLLMQDIVGRLFREFAVTVSITVLISAFVSLTLTPMLCARMLQYRDAKKLSKREHQVADFIQRTIDRYSISLRWVLEHQRWTLMVAGGMLILTTVLFILIPKSFFPDQDTGILQGISVAPPAISFPAMAERQQGLAKTLLRDPDILNLSSFIGIDGTNLALNNGRFFITLKPLSQRHLSANEIIQRLQSQTQDIPGITLYLQPIQDLTIDNRVSRTQYQYSIGAPDAADVERWTNLLMEKLRHVALLSDVTNDQQNKGLQTAITYDRDTAARLGITTQLIDDTLYDAFGQRQISTIFTQRNQYHVVLEVSPQLQESPDALANIYINSNTGGMVPLRVFTHVTTMTSPLAINRQGQFPVATLSFNLAPGAALGDAIAAINQIKQEMQVPENVQMSFEGAAKIFQNSLNNEIWLVLAAIFVVYIVLGVLYESYIHPLSILSTLPSACAGALLALFITGNTLSVIALIGIILLIGIVMKNAIMMIDFALDQERRYHKTPLEAIYEAALLRFRPIVMTTLASLFGAIPLAFSSGMGAELRHPLGIAIIGGLIVSQLLTLYTTPVIYLSFDKISQKIVAWRQQRFNSSATPQEW
jgi:multidrug efflux pump